MAATGGLGGLVVTLGLDATQYFTGLTKSEQEAKKFARQLEQGIARAGKLAAAGITLITGAAIAAGYAINHLVEQASDFKDIEERTGASAEALASFSVAAVTAGATVTDVGEAMNRLAKNLAGVDDDSKSAGAALAALGINISDFKRLDPAAQIEQVAKALGGFEDSASKGAVAMALFGKQGAQLLPFLKELNSGAGRRQILTQDEIDRADQFADAQKRVREEIKLYSEVVAIAAIPAIEGFIKTASKLIQELIGIDEKTTALARDQRIREFAEGAALKLGFLIDVGQSLIRIIQGITIAVVGLNEAQTAISQRGALGTMFDTITGKGSDAGRILANTRAELSALVDKPLFTTNLQNAFDEQRRAEARRAASNRENRLPSGRRLQFEGAVDKAAFARVAKARFDAEIKEQERAIKAEQDLLHERQHYLQGQYDDELIDFREYYAERQRIFDAAQTKILAAQNEQIDAARAFARRPGLAEDERLAAEEKLTDLIAKREETERSGRIEAYDRARAVTRATREYEDALEDVNARMLELSGNTEEALRIRLARQNRSDIARFTLGGDTESVANIRALEEQQIQRERLNKATQDYSNTVQRLNMEQARVDLEARSGAVTSLDAINKRSALARQYIVALVAQADAAERAAMALRPGPEHEAALLYVQRLRLEIDNLAESANELENTFRKTFEDSFASELVDAIEGTKSLADAFKSMVRSIVHSINQIAANNISEALFGKAGPLGKAPGFFASLFGGGGGGFGLFGGGFGSAQTGFDISSFLGFAGGGMPAVGKPALVGERGPELFVPRAAGNIIPNDELMARRAQRSVTNNINITVPGNVTRSTADQIAIKSGAAVQRAMQRNG